MWLWEEYIIRHQLDIDPADYGFETSPITVGPEMSIRVVRSEISVDNLWSFFIHHYNLDNWSRREFFRNRENNSINREQQYIFQAFPYLSSIWQSWQTNTPDCFRIIRRN